MPTNTVQRAGRAQTPEATVKDLVRNNWGAIAASLPASIDSKRFAQMVFNSVEKTPKLAEATARSLMGSVVAASALGLEVGTALGDAWILPYNRRNRQGQEWVEAQLIIGYQGIVRLFRNHPLAESVESGWIGEFDELDYGYGSNKHLTHKPNLGGRGKPIGVWARYTLTTGAWDFVVLSMEEAAQLRGKGVNEKRDVEDPQHWLARKTAVKQVLKLAPKSVQLAAALAADEQLIDQVVQMDGMESVARVMQVADTTNLGTVPGALGAVPERIDAATGEVHDAPAAVSKLTRVTGAMIVAQFERLGVAAHEVNSWLPKLGIPVDQLDALDEPDGVELLEVLTGMDRAALAKAGA